MTRYPAIVVALIAAGSCAKRPPEPSSPPESSAAAEVEVPPEVAAEWAEEVHVRARPACDGEVSVEFAPHCSDWIERNWNRGAPEWPEPVGDAPEGLRCWMDGWHWVVLIAPGATGDIRCALTGCVSPLFRVSEGATPTETLGDGPYGRPVTASWTLRWEVPEAEPVEVERRGEIVGAVLPRRAIACPEP